GGKPKLRFLRFPRGDANKDASESFTVATTTFGRRSTQHTISIDSNSHAREREREQRQRERERERETGERERAMAGQD
ncbi:unnamed protein product, partial [Musa acuminata subsp. burmannicoides]